jgi:hypothetical protein
MDLVSLSYPPVASRTRFLLTPADWQRAGLRRDDEANAWVKAIPGGGVRGAELTEEGVLVLWQDLMVPSGEIFASCPVCLLPDDWLRVRRTYRGPVPRQVLAAFRPDPDPASPGDL